MRRILTSIDLSGVVMRHDIQDESLGTVSEAYPHLIFNLFESKLGRRTVNILKYTFPVPKADSKRVMVFSNSDDFISFRHFTFEKRGSRKEDVKLKEVGPRFELTLYRIRLGTLEQNEADDEWVLRPHMNTARKRKAL